MRTSSSNPLLRRLRHVGSRQNSIVKDLRRGFARHELLDDGTCAIESVRVIEEAIRSGLRFRAVAFNENALSRAERLLPQLKSDVETVVVPDEIFRSMVHTETPQGVAALVHLRQHEISAAAASSLTVMTFGIQDPGNLGTIIRSAEAFGAGGFLQGPNSVSFLNSKAIRASAGSSFRMPIAAASFEEAREAFRANGVRVIGTTSHKGRPAGELDLTQPLALIIGSEGAGLPPDVLAQVDERVTIPQDPAVESLNAGVAASILLYEIARQRKSFA